MFEYTVYSNVSLIFECILKLRIFVMHIIYLLFYNYYKLTSRSVEKLATNHSTSASRSFSRTVRGKFISAFSTTTRRFYASCVDRGRI